MDQEDHMKEPLLEKKQYYKDCPGCKVEQEKELNQGVSIIKLVIIWMVVLSATLPAASLFPFLYFMVRDFNVAKEEADISYYAGYVGSSFMLGRSLTSVIWGMVSDRYGRKPVIIIGIIAVVIFNTLFGLSTSFWMAIITRFLLGSLNGVLGPVKAYATELFREEHQAIGLSTVSAAWGIGLIIGPAIGGYLAQPAEKYPQIFAKDSFWDKFPYFLPCFIISGLALTVAIACIWIPEFIHIFTLSIAMANSYFKHFITLSLLFFFISPTFSQQSFRPKALLLQVTKDSATTLQYKAQINQRTPLVPLNLIVDLGGQFLWVDCENQYISSTYRPARCRSAQCSLAKANGCGDCFSSPKPGCNNNTCGLIPDNTITHTATSGELAEDVLSIQSTNGFNPGRKVSVSRFLFSCAPTFLLKGLASGATGMAGLGRTKIALPSQLASSFSFDRKFAICLSSGDGVVIFGDGPYGFLPNVVLDSDSLAYTPLLINPVSTASAFSQGEPSAEYFIGVKTIKIDEKVVSLNTSLLSIDNNGIGGTKISTVDPYTVLEASIYKAVTDAFNKASIARNISRASSFAPFEFCYSSDSVLGTRLGASVPTIELVLQNENVIWRIFGANSMVNINDDVLCLGFVNGGKNPRTSIVIGGYQLENNLVQIDLAASRLGFSSLLFGRQTTCSNFNSTSTA